MLSPNLVKYERNKRLLNLSPEEIAQEDARRKKAKVTPTAEGNEVKHSNEQDTPEEHKRSTRRSSRSRQATSRPMLELNPDTAPSEAELVLEKKEFTTQFKAMMAALKTNPELIHRPELDFFAAFTEELGVSFASSSVSSNCSQVQT